MVAGWAEKMSLKSKFQLIFLLVNILLAFLIGFFAYRTSRSNLEHDTYAFLSVINQQKKARIQQWIENGTRQLETLAEMVIVDDENFFDHLLRFRVSSENYDERYQKRILVKYLKPGTESGLFKELFILNVPLGEVVVSTEGKQQGKIYRNRLFFMAGQRETYVENPFYSISIRQPTMLIATPLRDNQGISKAILIGRLNLEVLSDIMEHRTALKKTEDTYLVNEQNFFITEPRFGKKYALRKTVHSEGVNNALEGKNGIDWYNNYRDIPVIGAYIYLHDYKMGLITELDQSEFLEPIIRLQQEVFVIGLFASVIVLAIGWFMGEMVYKPVRQLSSAVEKIRSDNLDFNNPLSGAGEIGLLGQTVESLTLQLRKTLVSRKLLREEIDRRRGVERELQSALVEAKRSNEELEQFAYVASHDLQEPLRMVSSFTQLLAERYKDKLDDKGLHYIHFAVDGAKRMQYLIEDLLDYSRISTRGKDFIEVDMNFVFDQTHHSIGMLISESQAIVTREDLPAVTGDEVQLGQLLQNLLTNGIKFCAREVPRIHVSAESVDGVIRFMVEDNGIGIEEKHKEKVFVIFQRLHSREEYSGTGIGLALCKRIVNRHDGDIWFESEINEGTRFYFTLHGPSTKT